MQAAQAPAQIVLRRLLRVGVVLLFVSVPFASAFVALRYAPPAHVEIAGQPVAVKPVLGQDTSRLQGGALIRPEHAHVGFLGTNVGVDISADWNRLIPSDKQTRRYLIALWDDPQPEIQRIKDAARGYVVTWSLIGFLSGALVSGGVAVLLRERRRRLADVHPGAARPGQLRTTGDCGSVWSPPASRARSCSTPPGWRRTSIATTTSS